MPYVEALLDDPVIGPVIAECFLFLKCSGFAGSSEEQISTLNSVGASPGASVSITMIYRANPHGCHLPFVHTLEA